MHRSWFCLVCLGALVAAGAGHADTRVYRSTGPAGTSFSDQPQPGAVEITIPAAAVYTPRPIAPVPAAAAAADTAPYEVLELTAPVPESFHWRAEGPIAVTLKAEPPLAAEHHVVALVDGAERARALGSGRLSLDPEGLAPGRHAVVVEIRDAADRVLQRTGAVAFHYRQHTRNLPARTPPPATGTAGGG